MPTIAALLKNADLPDSPSPRVDSEWLLAAALDKPLSYLRTWPEREVPAEAAERFAASLARRRQGEPVAYILGRQGFWSLDLEVAPDTLIPRPDTELLVETALDVLPASVTARVLDLGSGTGAIALALAIERPAWRVLGVDRIEAAVALAERNRQRLGVRNASFMASDWFVGLADARFALIVSNPPYIPSSDPHLTQGDVRFEPRSALVAGDDGLDDIRLIIDQAPQHLEADGWLLLEHGYDQADAVRALLIAQGFVQVRSRTDLGGNPRVSLGRLASNLPVPEEGGDAH
ncbi:peptide chain release factor N(5)-glutamine methyltransferase [Stutzerimonas azotifigens]|uniref:Release factor glutamine methyltransferase n=1 Tax=Stutzerimonas azotifigens TaxID=291995 RepID=A0ABR5Z711_9GAMM|nr:peptide chain release factor N(5)-glutamine methyltransferase [Stutzerimonas azotifigens]MBA1276013.1 peptide chain release factor N(5)-glutamine methyltransferase [Stutzerimonas azotifigens]